MTDFFVKNDIEYATDISLKDISTFKIGGNAKTVCYPDTVKKVSEIIKYCKQNNVNYFIFGRCSNVVFSDDGIESLIIKTDRLCGISRQGDKFTFGAGVMLAKASKYTVDNGYAGLEFAYGVPGSVGGAVYMNAGAYGGEMSDSVISVDYADGEGNIITLTNEQLAFGYRHSFFSDKNFVILSTTLKLKKGDRAESEKLIEQFQSARKEKQPLDRPSAGSVFKRPEGYFAGKLIQDCGLKGFSVGGAQVSEKHSGFIINTGNATCADVKQLVAYIQNKVSDSFGVGLECELRFIND